MAKLHKHATADTCTDTDNLTRVWAKHDIIKDYNGSDEVNAREFQLYVVVLRE